MIWRLANSERKITDQKQGRLLCEAALSAIIFNFSKTITS